METIVLTEALNFKKNGSGTFCISVKKSC